MTRVKICGITNEDDLHAAVNAGADALGFVVDVPVDTPREVTPGRAADLVEAAPPFVTTVLVTMPETPGDAIDLVEDVRPDVLQVHGDLTPGDLAYVASNADAKLVKTVGADEVETAHRYDDLADALLVDSTDAAGAGGTGRTHDWTVTRDLARDLDSPVVLAGGLTPGNVAEAVGTVEPFAVDVASGVESEGGVKDHGAVDAFVRAATRDRAAVEP